MLHSCTVLMWLQGVHAMLATTSPSAQEPLLAAESHVPMPHT